MPRLVTLFKDMYTRYRARLLHCKRKGTSIDNDTLRKGHRESHDPRMTSDDIQLKLSHEHVGDNSFTRAVSLELPQYEVDIGLAV